MKPAPGAGGPVRSGGAGGDMLRATCLAMTRFRFGANPVVMRWS